MFVKKFRKRLVRQIFQNFCWASLKNYFVNIFKNYFRISSKSFAYKLLLQGIFLRYRYFQILLCLSSKVVPRISQDFFSGFFKKFCNKFARSFSRGFLHEFAKKFLWGIWKNIHSENFSNNISKSLRIPRISRVISFRNFCENSSKDPKKIKRSSKYFSRSSSEYSSIFFFLKNQKVLQFLRELFKLFSRNFIKDSSKNYFKICAKVSEEIL